MKLQQLAIGERFEYEGQVFVKTGPLTACGEMGGQRMIPRHAMLRPAGAAVTAATTAPAAVVADEARVHAAFVRFYLVCADLLPPASQAELAAARQRFLQEIA
jgi:hypothetical protein